MTPLRQRYLDDLRLRNYAPRTIQTYVARVACFARYFGRSPDQLGPDDVRAFQLELLRRHASWSQFNQAVCALRFLYGVTLGRPEQLPLIPYGKRPRTLPTVLAPQEVVRLIDAARPGRDRLLLQVAYACGLRISELVHLRVTDVDSARMVVVVRQGKGQKDRLVPLSQRLLNELRVFASWLAPLAGKEWVVYSKPPFGGPTQVLKYLARYTHRAALSNSRLVALEGGRGTFGYKDYADDHKAKRLTLPAEEFLRRFVQHVLPQGFVKVRHYGLLANRCREQRLHRCRRLLLASPPAAGSETGAVAPAPRPCCPWCGGERIVRRAWESIVAVPTPSVASPGDTS